MLTFHENPVLNDVHIPGFDADTVLSPDLLNSVELVKIRLATTSLEDSIQNLGHHQPAVPPFRGVRRVAGDGASFGSPSAAGTVVSATAVSMATSPLRRWIA